MIPYFEVFTFHLGPITLHTWGFVVSIGIAVALAVAYQRSKRLGLEANRVLDMAFWILVAAFIGARFFHVFFYEWPYYRIHLGEIWRIDQGGLSSFGGFIGALAAFWWYIHFRVISTKRAERARGEISSARNRHSEEIPRFARNDKVWLHYADLLMFAWPLGHGLGRLGCFLVHMHPGRFSNVPWAVQYPGGVRLDMGLVEAIVLLLYCSIVILFFGKKERFPGFYVVVGMIFYGATRFVLDFFRATDIAMADARYFGLTPAQYGSILLLTVGIYLYARCRTIRTVTAQ